MEHNWSSGGSSSEVGGSSSSTHNPSSFTPYTDASGSSLSPYASIHYTSMLLQYPILLPITVLPGLLPITVLLLRFGYKHHHKLLLLVFLKDYLILKVYFLLILERNTLQEKVHSMNLIYI